MRVGVRPGAVTGGNPFARKRNAVLNPVEVTAHPGRRRSEGGRG